jgi:NTP pyrophosphatase (non-canonical NTP hydrolase)
VNDPQQMVAEFHRHVGAAIRSTPTVDVPGAEMRVQFVEEEARELREAVEAGDVVAVADALADLAYVVYGGALHFGIPLSEVFAEVHRSNMTKSPAGDGKAIKGSAYQPPEIASLLAMSPAACPLHGAVLDCSDDCEGRMTTQDLENEPGDGLPDGPFRLVRGVGAIPQAIPDVDVDVAKVRQALTRFEVGPYGDLALNAARAALIAVAALRDATTPQSDEADRPSHLVETEST